MISDNRRELTIEKIRGVLEDEYTAALVTSQVNRRYLTGFPSSAGAVLITHSKALLLVDSRYFEAAQKTVKPPIEVIQISRLTDDLNRIFLEENIKSVIIEDEAVTVAQLKEYQAVFVPQVLTDGLSEKLSELRMVKTSDEIDKIITAQRITERAYTEVLNYLKPGVTERSIAVELEHLIKLYGGERVAFDLICITGGNTSLPHGVPGERVVKSGDFFTFDIGAVYDGYHSDMTRTVAVCSADDDMRRIYDIVLTAHNKAFEAINPGAAASDVDKAARDHISQQGYGEYFGHSTGHGVGLEIHEAPTVGGRCATVLQDGMVITDEPGIYLPGRFGVRIEDMVLVKPDGAHSLAEIPKELMIV